MNNCKTRARVHEQALSARSAACACRLCMVDTLILQLRYGRPPRFTAVSMVDTLILQLCCVVLCCVVYTGVRPLFVLPVPLPISRYEPDCPLTVHPQAQNYFIYKGRKSSSRQSKAFAYVVRSIYLSMEKNRSNAWCCYELADLPPFPSWLMRFLDPP